MDSYRTMQTIIARSDTLDLVLLVSVRRMKESLKIGCRP